MERVARPLTRHHASHTTAVHGIEGAVQRTAGGGLALRFVIRADMARIEVPPLRQPQRGDGLWRHTCFECFVRGGGSAYLEFNFSPSREWAAYAFRDYRDPAPAPADFDPGVSIAFGSDTLDLQATIPAAALALDDMSVACRAGLAAVVEETSGALSYWALHHAPGRPDFHRADAFVLEL